MSNTTTDQPTDDLTETVETYLAMWNEDDVARRADHIARAWAEPAHYSDPLLEAVGPEALSEMVDTVHRQFPNYRFSRTSGIDAHHDLIRFTWRLTGPDGTIAVVGTDVCALAPDGRLARVAGFFGDVPETAAA